MRLPIRMILLALVPIFAGSCARNIYTGVRPAEVVVFPAPPDSTRLQFLSHISSSADVEGKSGGFRRFLLGSEEPRVIGKPYGVTVHKGKIYLCDTFKKGFDVIDLEKHTFTEMIPSGLGELKVPLNCAFDPAGRLFIADSDRKQIVVLDEHGKYIASFGEKENFKPTDVFVFNGKIWVVNLTGHQVHVYRNDSSFAHLYAFPPAVKDSLGYLYSPTNLFVDSTKVYVTDFGDSKVKVYSHSGGLTDTIGSYGESLGQFARPKGLAVDRSGNLFTVDAGFENVQIFNPSGKLLMFFGGSYKKPGDMWLPAKVTIDYDNVKYFEKMVDPMFRLKYIVLVTNQFGPDKLNIYGAVEPAPKTSTPVKGAKSKGGK